MPNPSTPPRYRSAFALLAACAVAWFYAHAVVTQFRYAYERRDQLTEFFDAYSEANAIRAGEGFADHGLTWNAGLPDVAYGDRFGSEGGKLDKNLCKSSESCVYLHYPPAPDLLIGLMTKLFGKGRVSLFRLAPILFGAACLLIFGRTTVRVLGAPRAALVAFVLWSTPMAFNALHYLHYTSYTASLLLANVGALLVAWDRPRLLRRDYVAQALVSFLAGWLSFEWAPCVLLLPAGVALARDRAPWRAIATLTLVGGAAYALANVLHFLQVVVYLHGVRAALDDWRHRAGERMAGELWYVVVPGPVGVVLNYWLVLPSMKDYCNYPLAAYLFAVGAGLTRRASSEVGPYRLVWAPSRRHVLALFAGLAIPTLWIVVMVQHASHHPHFIGRNALAAVVLAAVAAVSALRVERRAGDEAPPLAS